MGVANPCVAPAAMAMASRGAVAAVTMMAACSAAHAPPRMVAIPNGSPGVGFDDLRFSPRLGVLAPAARTGTIAVVDPRALSVTTIGGFATAPDFDGGHDFGVTSVDDTGAALVAVDRTTEQVHVVDPSRGIVHSAALAHGPDYVRWVGRAREVWVTEPDAEMIEVFDADLARLGSIDVKGGPESLAIDDAGGRAYAHLWSGATVAIDLASRSIAATWKNGCRGSRGIAIDPAAHLVFVGCAEGGATALDTRDGKVRGRVSAGRGVDVIAYSASLHHLYLPSSDEATVTIAAVAADGSLRALGTVPGARGGHCGTTDDHGRVFVCAPSTGSLVIDDDPFAATAW